MSWPDRIENVVELTRAAAQKGNYLLTFHAQQRQCERTISRPEIEYVLEHGWHEDRKDKFDETHQAWNYAVRGQTFGDECELRIIVSFDATLIIVTVIDLDP
jgi:hypothetical protein